MERICGRVGRRIGSQDSERFTTLQKMGGYCEIEGRGWDKGWWMGEGEREEEEENKEEEKEEEEGERRDLLPHIVISAIFNCCQI